jgi:hypothetical protein
MNSKYKILFINDRTPYPNPFITTLANGIASENHLTELGVKEFWKVKNEYDIIHINWPELFFDQVQINEDSLSRLSDTFDKWKKKDTKIVFTRHDEKTHYVPDINYQKLFQIMETVADGIVHLGSYSKDSFMQKYPSSKQLHHVIPHHTYDTLYTNNISKRDARKAINIPLNKVVIMSFGAFRHIEEYLLVKDCYENLNLSNKFLLVPSWNRGNDYSIKNCYLGRGSVDEDMLPYCFAACDIVLIQRLRLLNSGNIPLAFLFNKTVVGPNIGNIGELLDNINNFSFDPFQKDSINDAMNMAVHRLSQGPQVNEEFARKNLNASLICDKYRSFYQCLM